MKTKLAMTGLLSWAFMGLAHGQFATSPPPAFFAVPSSTMGMVVGNNLTLTALPNGFLVAGTVAINIPAAPVSGVLVQWSVVRRVESNFAATGVQTQTILTGFSAPPAGTFGTSFGTVVTDFKYALGLPAFTGQSLVPMSLVNGVDAPAWAGLTSTSPAFTFNAPLFPTPVMEQTFTLFGNYTGGAGGVWLVDVPVTSITVVPEPPTALLLAGGGWVLFLARRRFKRRCTPRQDQPLNGPPALALGDQASANG